MSKPIRGLILGVLLGLGIAIVLQQAGVWPLDRLLVFGMAGLVGLIGILMSHVGRVLDARWPMVLAVLIGLGLLGFGATGLGTINETGELNGGCTVSAESDIDTTVVTDTSRLEPFDIDPFGGLSWVATSPGAIMDHEWEIWVDVGGFPIVVASGGDPNTAGDQDNVDSIVVEDAIDYLEFVGPEQIQGIYVVGGFIEGTAACDGFGFVRVGEGFLDTYLSWIGLAVALIALLFLIMTMIRGLRGDVVVVEPAVDDIGGAATTTGAGTAAEMEDRSDVDSDGAGVDDRSEGGRHVAEGPDDEQEGPARRDDM